MGQEMGMTAEVVLETPLQEIGRAAEQVERPVTVSTDTEIARDLSVDSIGLMNIVMALEDRFDISIPLDRMAEVQTAGQLADLIEELRVRFNV